MGVGCDKREACYRYRAKASKYQSYFSPDPQTCEYYWEMKMPRSNPNVRLWIHKKTGRSAEAVCTSFLGIGTIVFIAEVGENEILADHPDKVMFEDSTKFRREDWEDMGPL
jgi:hypothetical protein